MTVYATDKLSAHRYLIYLALSILFLCCLVIGLHFRFFPDNSNVVNEAFAWQERTHGIVEMPPVYVRSYKMKLLSARAKQSDIVVLGSSTSLSIRSDFFPDHLSLLNAAHFGSPSSSVANEFNQLTLEMDGGAIFVTLDWLLMYVYHNKTDGDILKDLVKIDFSVMSPPMANKSADQEIKSFLVAAADTLSLPQVRKLGYLIYDLHSKNALWTQLLYSYPEYKCDDGSLAKEYDSGYPGKCAGFRYDGSMTFNEQVDLSRKAGLTAEKLRYVLADLKSNYPKIIMESTDKTSSVFHQNLEIFDLITNRLDFAAKRWQAKGGKVIFFMPPHVPYLDAEYEASAYSVRLLEMRNKFMAWAGKAGYQIHDLGKSEKYGCTLSDLFDEVHALAPCYKKIFLTYPDFRRILR